MPGNRVINNSVSISVSLQTFVAFCFFYGNLPSKKGDVVVVVVVLRL